MEHHIIYVGLDVHKDTIAEALAEGGERSEVRDHGKISNTPAALKTLCAKLARNGGKLRFCHEAGPCGYGVQRQSSDAGHECAVAASSLIARKPGDRIKTDRRDAINLAKRRRAGELTSVWVPDPRHEAIRDLVRTRLAAVRVLRQARQNERTSRDAGLFRRSSCARRRSRNAAKATPPSCENPSGFSTVWMTSRFSSIESHKAAPLVPVKRGPGGLIGDLAVRFAAHQFSKTRTT
jgi:transposase